jgi:hypothetical protein
VICEELPFILNIIRHQACLFIRKICMRLVASSTQTARKLRAVEQVNKVKILSVFPPLLSILSLGCSLYTMRVFENRVLRRIFGPKRDEVGGGWRKLHNGELHNLYSLPNIIRMHIGYW